MSNKQTRAEVELIINGQTANATLKNLEAAARKVRAELSKLKPDSKEFDAAAKSLKNINSELNKTKIQAGFVKSSFDKMKESIKATFIGNLGANLTTLGLAKLSQGLLNGIETFKQFESSLKNLSAITGLVGNDLKYMGEEAQKTALQTGIGAKDVVEAYKLIASAKPELLENKEALAAFTKEAIALSQASGLDLPEAAKRLTDAMNQFSAPANEAGRYINVLAEAARLSAAEVPDLSEALVQFGVAAKSANVSIEESSAVIETLAEKGIKGSEAGNKLRNVFIALNAPGALDKKAIGYLEQYGVNLEVLSDKSIPLQARLVELSKIQKDAGAITSVFGKENSIAAQILMENTGRVKELTDALNNPDLKTAYEQAAVNTQTLGFATARLGTAWDNIMTKQGAIGSFLTLIIQKFTNILIAIDNIKSEADLMFGGIQTASQKTKEYLIDFGKTESGKQLSTYFQVFDKLNNKDFYTKASTYKQQFIDLMVKEGESAEDAGVLFDAYAKKRTDAMIASYKNGANVGLGSTNIDAKNTAAPANSGKTGKTKTTAAKEEMDALTKSMYAQIDVLRELRALEETLPSSSDLLDQELEKLDATQKSWQEMTDEIDQYNKEQLAKKAQTASDIGYAMLDAYQSITNLMAANDQKDLNRFVATQNKKMAALDAQRAQGLISEEGYQKQKQALEEETAKKQADFQREQAKKQKAAAIFQATIDAGLAWVTAAVQYWNPAAIAAAIAASVRLGAISATPIPEFEQGGFTGPDAMGMYNGKGIAGVTHPNEFVINSKQLQNPYVYNMAKQLSSDKTASSVQPNSITNNSSNGDFSTLILVLNNLNNTLIAGVKNKLILDEEFKFKLNKELKTQTELDEKGLF
jgi:TP901 family phage tail tape measure protein